MISLDEVLDERGPRKDRQSLMSTCAMSLCGSQTAPLAVKPKEAARLIGGSRSEVYRLLRGRHLQAVKRGASLLVLMSSIHEHMASLPAATFGNADAQAACIEGDSPSDARLEHAG
jgi:hypothetical protein